jgi:hypothetical protein
VGKWQLQLLSQLEFVAAGSESQSIDAAKAIATAAKTAEVRAIRRVDSL